MRHLILTAFLVTFALPVAAQAPLGGIAYDPSGGPGMASQALKIRKRVEDGRDSGQLSRPEAKALKREARQIGRLSRRYGHGGLSEGERRELQARIDYLNGMVSARRSRGWGR